MINYLQSKPLFSLHRVILQIGLLLHVFFLMCKSSHFVLIPIDLFLLSVYPYY